MSSTLNDADRPDGTGQGGAPRQDGPGGWRKALKGRRGLFFILALAIVQAVFATILIQLRSDATPVAETDVKQLRKLAVEMLGHEVAIERIYQLLPAPGGKRMTVGLDIVLILGQLPEERVDGAPRPTEAEMETFIDAIHEMEPAIRSRVNILLQRIPIRDQGTVESYALIKDDVFAFVNDTLEGLNFGRRVRPGIGKRRVTEVLLPMFVRQTR